MRRTRLFTAFILLFSSFCVPGFSFDSYPLFYETIRTRGMGGVCVGVADDEQVLYSNPAGLGFRQKKAYALLSLAGEMNQDYKKVKNETDTLVDADTPEGRHYNAQALSKVMGRKARLEVSNFAYYLGHEPFGVGILGQSLGEISAVRPTNPRVSTLQVTDTVLSGSFARKIPGKNLVLSDKSEGWWGATLKVMSRAYKNREYDARDFAILGEKELTANQFHGTGADIDFGTYWALDNAWWQTIGLTVGNILGSELDPSVGNLRRWYAVGTAIRPLSGPAERKKKLVLAADMWNPIDNESAWNKVRLGIEGLPWEWLKVRGGVRGGYLSAGFTATFRLMQFDFATYSEERGRRPGDWEDRRYSGAMSVIF